MRDILRATHHVAGALDGRERKIVRLRGGAGLVSSTVAVA